MDRTTVAQARQRGIHRQTGRLARLGAHAPRFQRRLQLHRAQRRLLLRQRPDRRRGHPPQLRIRNQETHRRLQRHHRRRSPEIPRQGPGHRGQGDQVIVHGGPIRRRIRSRRKGAPFEFLRTVAHLAAAHQHVRRHGPRSQLRQQIDSRFLPGTGFSLHPRPDHHRQRLRRGRRDVQGHDARSRRSRRCCNGKIDYTQDFFGKPAYLTVSGQLQGEIFACGLGKVYTFGPTFRAENSNTTRHLAEFWMIEPEMAFYDLYDNMTLAEAFIKRIITDALSKCEDDMKFFAGAHRQGSR